MKFWNNMLKVIKGTELQELLDNNLICLRCGVDKRDVKKECSVGCKSCGTYYKKHIYK